MIIRAIACDIDQTLTNQDHRLDLSAVEVIRFLYAVGFPVILVTARDYMTAGWLSIFFGGCGLIIAENGAVIWDARKDAPPQVLGDPRRVRRGLIVLKEALGERVVEVPTPSRLCGAIVRGSFQVAEGNAVLREHGVPAQLVDSGLAYHLCDAETDKGSGLRAASARLGIQAAEIAAIGDNFNDISMFTTAGFSIAVGNAPVEVKRQVNYACSACYGEGFCEGVRFIWNGLALPGGVRLPLMYDD